MKPANMDYLFEPFGEVMTPDEVCKTIRASVSYVHGLIERGDLPCFRVGRQYRVLKRDVLHCLKNPVPTASPVPALDGSSGTPVGGAE